MARARQKSATPDSADKAGSDDKAVGRRAFRDALGCFATGVTVITTRAPDGRPVGLTVNSFNAVSLDPPLVVWSISMFAPSLPAFNTSEYFAVNVLAKDQAALSAQFAQPAEDKFARVRYSDGIAGVPLLDNVAARFECRQEHRHYGGDHLVLIGAVERFEHWDREPLLFHRGRYASVKTLGD